MDHLRSDIRRLRASRTDRAHVIQTEALVEHADDDFAFAQGALVGIALSSAIWMVVLGLGTTLL